MLLMVMALPLIIGCSKDSDSSGANPDIAGVYSVSVEEHVVWGNSSGVVNDTGTLYITVSGNRVSTSGYFSTSGQISGNNIYFTGMTSQDEAGYTTTTFGTATFLDNVITFQAYQSGQLKSHGVDYPYSNTSYFTCIKQTKQNYEETIIITHYDVAADDGNGGQQWHMWR